MTFDTTRFAANFRAIHANQPPIALGLPKFPPRPSIDYGLSAGELAHAHGLIRGALRVHPNHHNFSAFVSMLTPMQQVVYQQMQRGKR